MSAQIESNAIYSRYLERQRLEIISFKKDESLVIPVDRFNDVKGLSNEARDRVSKMKLERLDNYQEWRELSSTVLKILSYIKTHRKIRNVSTDRDR